MSSFQRQLNLYGFQRVAKGQHSGSYYHPKFQRGRPELVSQVTRMPQKKAITASSSHPSKNATNNIGDIVTTRINQFLPERKLITLNNYEAAKQFVENRAGGSGAATPSFVRVHCISSRYESKNVMKLLRDNQSKDPHNKMPPISKLTKNLLGLTSSSPSEGSNWKNNDNVVTKDLQNHHRHSPSVGPAELKTDGFKIYRYNSWSPVDRVTAAAFADQNDHQQLPRPTPSAPPVLTSNMVNAPKRPSDTIICPTQSLNKTNIVQRVQQQHMKMIQQSQPGQSLPRKLNLIFRQRTQLIAPSQPKDASKSPVNNDVQHH